VANYRVNFAGLESAVAVSALRIAAYASAPEFDVSNPQPLLWGREDEENLVLAVWHDDGSLLSTLRIELYLDDASAEAHMECSLPAAFCQFPALLLGKAASTLDSRNSGLHTILRYVALQSAMLAQVRALLGIVYEGAPRTRLMQRCGYEFFRPERVWYTDLKPLRPTLVAILAQAHFKRCSEVLLDQLGSQVPDLSGVIRRAANFLEARLQQRAPWALAARAEAT
jgi:hypothetical protein